MKTTFFVGVVAAVAMAFEVQAVTQNFNLAQIGEDFDNLALS